MSLSKSQILHNDSYKKLNINYNEALAYIRERNFTNKSLGITYRELNHWSTKGLLFESNEFGKWRKFNILEMVWIELLKELRLYNFPLDTIQIIKKSLMSKFDLSAVFEMDVDNNMLEVMKLNLSPEDCENFMSSVVDYKTLINENIINEFLPENLLEPILLEAYFLKSQYRIIINHKGEVSFSKDVYMEHHLADESFNLNFERSNISISINTLISNIFQDYTKEELKLKWKLINEEEEKILDVIQSDKKMKSINIRFNDNSKIDLLQYTEELSVSPNYYLKKLILAGGYNEIKVITQKGGTVLCERTVKQKI